MIIKPNMAQGHLPKALQQNPRGGLEEVFDIPMETAPLPGDIVYVPDRKDPKESHPHVVVRRYFHPFGYGLWNMLVLVRPLTEEERQQYNCEWFGIKKWPETDEEIRAFEEKFLPRKTAQD